MSNNCKIPDTFWLEDITQLFCSLSPIPRGPLHSATRLNAVTRLILYVFVIMLSMKYKYSFQFLVLSLLLVVLIFESSNYNKRTENYAFLSSPTNNKMNYKTLNDNVYAKHSNVVLFNQPKLVSYTDKGAFPNMMSSFLDKNGSNDVQLTHESSNDAYEKNFPIRSYKENTLPVTLINERMYYDEYKKTHPLYSGKEKMLPDNVINERLNYEAYQQTLPIYSNNESNNYKGSSDLAIKSNEFNFEGGKRQQYYAGIQYYPINQGVNRKTMIQPIIAPRSLDIEYWGKSATNIDRINRRNYTDVTEDEMFRDGTPGGLGVQDRYRSRVKNAVEPMNNINDHSDNGYYGSGEIYYGNETRRDFENNIMPLYSPKTNINGTVDHIYNSGTTLKYEDLNNGIKFKDNKNNIHNIDKEDMMNMFNNSQYKDLMLNETRNIPSESVVIKKDPSIENWYNKDRTNEPSKKRSKEGFDFMPLGSNEIISDTYGSMGKVTPVSQTYDMLSRLPEGEVLPNTTRITDQMLDASPTYVYNDKFFNDPTKRLFLQDVQPKIYSWAVEQTPINSNIGITYEPQIPPRVLDQAYNTDAAYPLYSRIDPQLVRTDGTPGQLENNPTRTNWSANYSSWIPPPGTINFEDVYDPRYSSYGDPYRSYSDVNLGQVQYYYSDVDAYKNPNFITRSNVDFMEYRTPQNQVWPQYERTASADDVKPYVEGQYAADELFHREDMMEHQMSKRNRESWQQRSAPLRRSANSSMPFGPT